MRRCLAALFIVIGCLWATQAAAERRVALVVGNSQYEHTTALANPHHDAEDIAGTLEKVGFDVKVGYDLDQVEFARLIDEFSAALEGADVGLFFYAGHGLQINDKNYLVSVGAKLESAFLVPSETIELDAIIKLMESKASTNLVFLDACRNNPLADNLKRNLAAAHRDASVGRGLAPIAPSGRDTLVAFSAAPGELAADGTGRNSPFASALLRHLPEPGLEVSVMLKDVTADVRRDTDNKQRPQQLSDMSRKFYFVKAEPPAAPPAPSPPVAPSPPAAVSDPVELAFWQSAAAANDCESIRAYLRRYPGGAFADLAVVSERRLCKPTEVVTAPPQPQPAPGPLPTPPAPDSVPALPPAPAPIPTPAAIPSPAAVPGPATIPGPSMDMWDLGDGTYSVKVGQVGLVLAPWTGSGGGVVVKGISPSPANNGIASGDVIIDVNGKLVREPADVANAVSSAEIEGRRIRMLVKSAGRLGAHFVDVPTGNAPPDARVSIPWDGQGDSVPHRLPPRPGGRGRR